MESNNKEYVASPFRTSLNEESQGIPGASGHGHSVLTSQGDGLLRLMIKASLFGSHVLKQGYTLA